jgi:hypothetical protein
MRRLPRARMAVVFGLACALVGVATDRQDVTTLHHEGSRVAIA